jgi:RNA polymerase sigma-70 factor (ECF subfamily)
LFGIRKKQRDHFKALAYPHITFLYNVAMKYMGDPYDAEDLVQETMYGAFRNFGQLRDESKCRSWLFAILLEGVAQGDLCRDYEKKLEAISTRESLERLPEKYKTVLVLFFLEDMSYQEISEIIDVPIGTVMSRLSRAKQQMKKELLREVTMKDAKIIDIRRAAQGRTS